MVTQLFKFSGLLLIPLIISSCSTEDPQEPGIEQGAILEAFGGEIDLKDLENYAQQSVPSYISKDNSVANPITDASATLGRVLFYDNNLSVNKTVSCSSCHQQAFAFSDDAIASEGVNGTTGRHSMRLVNARFAQET